MEKLIKKFEKITITSLLVMMGIVVLISTVELAVILVQQVMQPPRFFLDINNLLTIFGFFLVILIGIELVETLKVYIVEEMVRVEIVFLVAIIAVTRKVIIVNIKTMEPLTLIGIAALILALSGGYYLLKKALDEKKD